MSCLSCRRAEETGRGMAAVPLAKSTSGEQPGSLSTSGGPPRHELAHDDTAAFTSKPSMSSLASFMYPRSFVRRQHAVPSFRRQRRPSSFAVSGNSQDALRQLGSTSSLLSGSVSQHVPDAVQKDFDTAMGIIERWVARQKLAEPPSHGLGSDTPEDGMRSPNWLRQVGSGENTGNATPQSRSASFAMPPPTIASQPHVVASPAPPTIEMPNVHRDSFRFIPEVQSNRVSAHASPGASRTNDLTLLLPSSNHLALGPASAQPSFLVRRRHSIQASDSVRPNVDEKKSDSQEVPGKDGATQGPLASVRSNVGWSDEKLVIRALDVGYVATFFIQLILASSVLAERAPDSFVLFATIAALCQLWLLVWTGTRFFLQTSSGYEIVYQLRHIRQHYAKTWLTFDLLMAVPIELIFVGWAWQVFFGLQLRHALRVPRIATLATSGNPLVGQRRPIYVVSLVGLVLMCGHAFAIAFSLERDSDYLTGMYWTVLTMTSVGYGDIVSDEPPSGELQFISMIGSLCGVGVVALLTAVTTFLVAHGDAVSQRNTQRNDMLHAMLKHFRVPLEEQCELITMVPHANDARNEREFNNLIALLPDYMITTIQGFIRARQLTDCVPLFITLEESAIVALAQMLSRVFVRAGTALVRSGVVGTECYFIIRGVVEIFAPVPDTTLVSEEMIENEGLVEVDGCWMVCLCELGAGDFFGEAALIADQPPAAVTAVAAVLCEMLVLAKDDYEKLATQFPAVREIFEREVMGTTGVESPGEDGESPGDIPGTSSWRQDSAVAS